MRRRKDAWTQAVVTLLAGGPVRNIDDEDIRIAARVVDQIDADRRARNERDHAAGLRDDEDVLLEAEAESALPEESATAEDIEDELADLQTKINIAHDLYEDDPEYYRTVIDEAEAQIGLLQGGE